MVLRTNWADGETVHGSDINTWNAAINALGGGGGGDPATAVHAAVAKGTPIDADEMLILDSGATFGLKKVLFGVVKNTLKTYLDSVISVFTNKSIDFATNTITGTVAQFNTACSNADFYTTGGTDIALADGGTGVSLTDPNADRLMFWDDSAGNVAWLTLGTNLSITGTTMDATGGGGGGDPASATHAASAKTTFVDADEFPLADSAGSFVLKKGTWGSIKALVNPTPIVLTSTLTLPALANTDYVYLLGASGLPTLPTAVANTSKYTIKNTTGTAINVVTTSSQTIEAAASPYSLASKESITLVSDNANWWII